MGDEAIHQSRLVRRPAHSGLRERRGIVVEKAMISNFTTFSPAVTTDRKAGLRETAALLFVAWLVPFAVHLIPWSGDRPLGAYLLPMFWTAFVAVYFYGVRMALVVALFAPAINLVVTGLPAWRFLSGLASELVVFTLIAAWAVRRAPRAFVIAPLACLVARLVVAGLQTVSGFRPPGAFVDILGQSIRGGLAALVVLLAINGALVIFYPKTRLAR